MEIESEYLKRILRKAIDNLELYTKNQSQQFLENEIITPLTYVIKSDPNNFHANKFLGLVHFYFNQDIMSGEEYMLKAKAVKPDTSEISYYLGLINIEKGEPEIAIKYFEESLGIEGDNLETLFSLSQLYWDMENHKKAIDAMDLLDIYKNMNNGSLRNMDKYENLRKQISDHKMFQTDKRGYPEAEFCILNKEESFISSILLTFFESNKRIIDKELSEMKELYFDMISTDNSFEENTEYVKELKLFAKVIGNPKKYQLDEETLDKRIDAWLNYNKKIKK